MSTVSSEIEKLLSQKHFRLLKTVVKMIREVEIELDSSEDLARYSSRSSKELLDKDLLREEENKEWKFDRKSWKKFSSKQRKILFSCFLLTEPEVWRRELLREFLETLNTDSSSRTYVQLDNLSLVSCELSEYSPTQIRDLSRKLGDILSLMRKLSLSFSDLFQPKFVHSKKKKPKRAIRHKGYRDHGSLGIAAVGLTPKQISQLIDNEEMLLREENIPSTEELFTAYDFITTNFTVF